MALIATSIGGAGLAAGAKGGISAGTALAIAGGVATVASGLAQAQAAGQAAAAQEAAAASQLQAAQFAQTLAGRRAESLEDRAGQERAAAQRAAIEQRRQGRFAQSRARAVAAAGGAAVSDPTVVGLLGDIDTEAELRALGALSEGEELARGLEFGALLERKGGEGELFAGQVESNLLRRRAAITRSQGRQALISSAGSAATIGANTLARSGSSTLFSRFNDPFARRSDAFNLSAGRF